MASTGGSVISNRPQVGRREAGDSKESPGFAGQEYAPSARERRRGLEHSGRDGYDKYPGSRTQKPANHRTPYAPISLSDSITRQSSSSGVPSIPLSFSCDFDRRAKNNDASSMRTPIEDRRNGGPVGLRTTTRIPEVGP